MKRLLGVLACLAALIVITHATPHHASYSSPPDTHTTHVTKRPATPTIGYSR